MIMIVIKFKKFNSDNSDSSYDYSYVLLIQVCIMFKIVLILTTGLKFYIWKTLGTKSTTPYFRNLGQETCFIFYFLCSRLNNLLEQFGLEHYFELDDFLQKSAKINKKDIKSLKRFCWNVLYIAFPKNQHLTRRKREERGFLA